MDYGQVEVKHNVVSESGFSDTLPFGKEFVELAVSPDALRKDLVAEAMQRGVEEEKARDLAEKIRFHFRKDGDYIRADLERSKGVARLIHIWQELFQPRQELGMVIFADEEHEGLECMMDIPEEAHKAALPQAMQSIWMHEREHLLDELFPETVNQREGEWEKNTLIGRISAVAFFAGTLVMFGSLKLPDEIRNPLLVAGMIVSSGGVLGSGLREIWWNKHAGHEKRAYSIMKSHISGGVSPFRIEFQS